MDALTQDLLAAGALLLAVAYLGWRGWRTLRGKKTGCGCDTCPAVTREVPVDAPARPLHPR